MASADQQHLDWLARSFGSSDYAPLGESDLNLIARAGEQVACRPGSHLFRQDDESRAAFAIQSGEVEIYRGSGKGRRVVSRAGPGSMLGDLALFRGMPYLSSARALSHVEALRFDRARLLSELAVQPDVCLRWLLSGLEHVEATQRRVIRLMHKTVLARVADLLGEEVGGRSEVNLSQSTIATLLGVSRQSVNEATSKMREEGIVETGYRSIRILDPDALAEVAEG